MADSVKFTFLSWNATGFVSSGLYIQDCFSNYSIDFFGVSEHWLFERDLDILYNFNGNYSCYAVSDGDLEVDTNRRVGKGGVALYWNKKYDRIVSKLPPISDRMIGIQIELSPSNFLFVFQVYLPSKNHNMETFKNHLESIQEAVSSFRWKGKTVVMGDFNCHVNSSKLNKQLDSRDMHFSNFLESNSLTAVTSLDSCAGAPASFVSSLGCSVIDNVLIPACDVNNIVSCEIVDDHSLLYSNHRVVRCCLNIPIFSCPECAISAKRIKWSKVAKDNKYAYRYSLENDIGLLTLLNCDISNEHDIDVLYNSLIYALINTADVFIPFSTYKRHLKPYWCEQLSSLNKHMKECRRLWKQAGSPNHGSLYTNLKDAKRTFRKSHRIAVEKYLIKLYDDIDHAAEVDQEQFWYLVNKRRNSTSTAPGSEMVFDGI